MSSNSSSTKVLHVLAWNIDDLSRLSDECSKIVVELQCIQDIVQEAIESSNIPRRLNSLRERLLSMLQGIYRFRHSPATHIFVIMISAESRNKKPYALPIQCVPYRTLTDNDCRKLMDGVIMEMNKRGMKVAGNFYILIVILVLTLNFLIGCVTNGEFNSLRCRGSGRPLSVLQIRADVRNEYSKRSKKAMLKMITPKRNLTDYIMFDNLY